MPVPQISYVETLQGVWFQQELVTDVVRSLTFPPEMRPARLVLSVHTNAIRVRWDGGDPTTTLGHQLTAGAGGQASDASRIFQLLGPLRIRAFRYVRDGTAAAEIAWTLEALEVL
jgi:hypothetical protein